MTLGSHKINLILHGGLGNQLFQYLKACAQAGTTHQKLVVHTGFLGRYQSARTMEIVQLVMADRCVDSIIADRNPLVRLRLPKVIYRLTKREYLVTVPFHGVIIDGYFQLPADYDGYPDAILLNIIEQWREIYKKCGFITETDSDSIIHLRLGDFFRSRTAATSFAIEQLRRLDGTTDLVTDQEDIVREALRALNIEDKVVIRLSHEMSAWELMRLMTRYASITTNGSTLAFWAAVLGRGKLVSTNAEHVLLHRRLVTLGNEQPETGHTILQ